MACSAWAVRLLLIVGVIYAPGCGEVASQTGEMNLRLDGVTTAKNYTEAFDQSQDRWEAEVPRIRDVRIRSTRDGHDQPALWLSPSGDGSQPLLVVLHSWSTEYLQHVGIPFAQWADQMGWGMIHPNFRGANDDSQATGSDLSLQDIVDAIDFATERANIDRERVYLIGFSGGAYQTLLMAGRHPSRISGAVAWVPIHDLVPWYEHHLASDPTVHYVEQIRRSCGGDPTEDAQARASCDSRSPRSYLDEARRAEVPIYIGHGLDDKLVPPSQAAAAFNQLAQERDRLAEGVAQALGRGELPGRLRGSVEGEPYFAEGEPAVLFSRRSGPVRLVLFDGGHDMVYHPGLAWLTELAAGR